MVTATAKHDERNAHAGRVPARQRAVYARRTIGLLQACVYIGVVASILFPAHPGMCANFVRVETLSNVAPGATGVRIGVYFQNDLEITGLVLPLELRTCSGGAYFVGPSFRRQLTTSGRIYNSPLGVADPGGKWPDAMITNRTCARPDPSGDLWECPRYPDSVGYWKTSAALPDFVSPDAILLATISVGDPHFGELITLLPGSDPAGTPSYEIVVTVGTKVGVFVVDTTCLTPANHLAYVAGDPAYLIEPAFQMGAVGVGTDAASCASTACDCPCHADPVNCGGPPLGILDVVSTIDVAFRGVPATRGPKCPFEDTDLDCGGLTDIVDVVRVIDVELRGVPRVDRICNPCNVGR